LGGFELEIRQSFRKIEEKVKSVVSHSSPASKEALRQRFKSFQKVISSDLPKKILEMDVNPEFVN
jgi:predicted phosphoribosyltransferase